MASFLTDLAHGFRLEMVSMQDSLYCHITASSFDLRVIVRSIAPR